MSDAQFYEALQSGDLKAALAVFDSVEDRDAAADTLQDICEEHLDINNWDELQLGLQVCDVVVPLSPERSDIHFWKLQALGRLGRFDEAFAFANEHKDGRPIVLFELFEMSCIHGEYARATELLPELEQLENPGAAQHFYNLGCKIQGTGALPQAIALYEGAIACGHHVPQASINAGIAALSLGRLDDAERFARAGLEHAPREPNLWANLADVASRRGEVEEVRKIVADGTEILGANSRCDDCDHASQVTACTIGCGALLDDLMGAMMSIGDHRAALDLYDSHAKGQEPPQTRVLLTRARALALSGDPDKADAILDGGIPLDDARTVPFYRARAAAAWANDDRERAIGALAAAINIDAKAAELLRNDPAFEAIRDDEDLAAGRPIRPPSVPAKAWWDADDWGEWVLGEKDDQGRKQGLVRYWRADGSLCCECPHVDDQPHGHSKRYHELGGISQEAHYTAGKLHGTRTWHATDKTTTERMHVQGMSTDIRRSEMDYDNDRVVEVRHYLGDGRQCAMDGTPYPDRPEGVHGGAFYNPDEDIWRFGELDEDGKGRGTWRSWDSGGQLVVEEQMQAGERHGSYRELFSDGTVAVVGQYDEGDKTGVFEYFRRGENEPDDFPTAGQRVVRVETSHDGPVPVVRYFDADDQETTIDGTPVSRLPELHPELGDFFEAIRAVDWSQLEDAGGPANSVPQILVGLLAQDEGDSEDISDDVYGDLYWHLCHQGTTYSATAAALPFIIRLAAYEGTPHRAPLLSFVSSCCSASRGTLEQARAEDWDVFLDSYQALVDGVDSLLGLLSHEDPIVRCAVTRPISGAHDKADAVTDALIAACENDDDDRVKSSALFALGRLATDRGLEVLNSSVQDESLAGACASMALVMARGDGVSKQVVDRLIAEFANVEDRAEAFSELPWADDHLMSELAQAVAYGGGGGEAVLEQLIGRFDSVDSLSALSLVQAAIMIGIQQGQGLNEELAAVLRALAESEKPWTFDVNLREILGQFNLPTDREGLLELVS